MTKGVLIFAHNNAEVDYIKIANFAAKRVKEFLDIPVSIVTNGKSWLLEAYPDHVFDSVIEIENEPSTQKLFYDGSLASKKLDWKNTSRNRAYELTPYDTTLVIDSDYIINSSILKNAFEVDAPLQIYHESMDLANWRPREYWLRVNPYSVPFYWATSFVFQKDAITEAFFNLISYIKFNWSYFRVLYNIEAVTFRNDYAFSIAIHIMNGKTNGEFAKPLPGKMTFIQDKDLLVSIKDDSMLMLVEKEKHLGEYIAVKTQGIDVHVMNKHSLLRFIDGGSGV